MSIEIRRLVVPERLGTPEAPDFEPPTRRSASSSSARTGATTTSPRPRPSSSGRHRDESTAVTRCSAPGTAARWSAAVGLGGSATQRAGDRGVHARRRSRSQRRRGVGSQLLAAAEQAAHAAGPPAVVASRTILTRPTRPAARTGRGTSVARPCSVPPTATPIIDSDAGGRLRRSRMGTRSAQLERVSSIDVDGRTAEFRSDSWQRLPGGSRRIPSRGLDRPHARTPRRRLRGGQGAHGARCAGGRRHDRRGTMGCRTGARAASPRSSTAGRSVLVAAAVTDDGEVAGLTELELPPDRPSPTSATPSWSGAHRGHGLGMLREARQPRRGSPRSAPDRTLVYTWNADENEHMLAINVALGFRPIGLEAIWQRELDEATPQAEAG